MISGIIGTSVGLAVGLIGLIVGVVVPLIICVIPILLIMGVVWLLGLFSRGDGGRDDRDAQTMQEIHRGLARMEQRLESLETLMADREQEPYSTR
ncbi:MAG: hypothetical protein AMXMBFR4_19300 [Candidatus Hydrogenedentota bacterium]